MLSSQSKGQLINVFNLKSYMIEETPSTPFAGISTIDQSLLIQGHVFLCLKMSTFRGKVMELLYIFYQHGDRLKKVRIDLEIMETGSVGWMFEVLTLVWNHKEPQDNLEIIWYYDHSNLRGFHQGQKISKKLGIPMTFISKD